MGHRYTTEQLEAMGYVYSKSLGNWRTKEGVVVTNVDEVPHPVSSMSVENTLIVRGKTHGDFHDNAKCSQELKAVFRGYGYDSLASPMREALDQIALKISRIMTGDCDHIDNWHDIAGYAMLVEKWLSPR